MNDKLDKQVEEFVMNNSIDSIVDEQAQQSCEGITGMLDMKNMIVKVSYNPYSNNFFIDLWENPDKYIVSIKVTEKQAENISKNIGVRILV